MSLNTILTTVSGKIRASHITDILSALRLQFVGRNSAGAPASGQELGNVTYPWGTGHFNSLRVGGAAIDVSNIVSPANRVVSGAVRTLSEQPQFLSIDGVNDEVTVLGATTTLVLSINAAAVSVEADILFQALTVAPAANNTCLVDDATLTDQLSSKYAGEDDSILTIGTVGTEISSRVGELIALRKNGSTEIMLAYVKSVTELSNIYRGFFYDSSDAAIVRETLADTDQLDIMSLGWIFIENTGTSGEIIYTNPVYSYTEPSAPTTADYWLDMSTNIWKRYSGSAFVQINRTLVGLVVVDATKAIGYRPVDFFHDYRDTNTIDLEIFSDEVIRSKDKTNNVYVYSANLRVDPTKLTWDNTADMETGSVAASTTYYLYLSSTGERIISLEKYYTRNDLLGKYHPYEAWLCIGEGTTDGTSDWLSFKDGVQKNIASHVHDFGDKNKICHYSIDIGAWDMDATSSIEIAHSFDINKIVSASVLIRHDDGLSVYPLNFGNISTGIDAGLWFITSSNISLHRSETQLFNSTNFDNTAINRGSVEIWYDTTYNN